MGLHTRDRASRHPVELEGLIERDGGRTCPARVTNLSLDGCCIERGLRIGEFVDVSLPQLGRHRAQVRWSLMGKSGLRFQRGTA